MSIRNIKRVITTLLFTVLIGSVAGFGNGITNETVKAEDGQTPILEIISQNISYSDSIYVLYAVKSSGFDRNSYKIDLLFWDEPQEEYLKGTESYTSESKRSETVNGEDCLIYYSKGLAAKEMVDESYTRAYVEINGVGYYSEVKKYSVLEYVYTQNEKTDITQEQKDLYKAMLEYGAAAQKVLDYKEDRLANASYYKITVENGVLPDGFTSGRYLLEETIEIKANQAEDGYVFSHWEDASGTPVETDPLLTVTVKNAEDYKAVYARVVRYTFETNGGTEVEPIVAVSIDELPTTTREGYVFKGWYDNAEFEGQSIEAPYKSETKSVLYAKWESDEQQNDGSTMEKAIEIEKGKRYDITIDEMNESVYLVINIAQSDLYRITSIGDLDTMADLYDENGDFIQDYDNGEGMEGNFEIDIDGFVGDTYYIKVYIWQGTGTFTVTVT